MCECAAGNCAAVLVATASGAVHYLAVDPNFVYWSDTTKTARAPIAGGGAVDVIHSGSGTGVAVDSNAVYFAVGDARVFSLPLTGINDGGVAAPLGSIVAGTSTPEVLAVAVDPSGVYASSYTLNFGEPVSKFPLAGLPDGGHPLVLGQGDSHCPSTVLTNGSTVFWSTASAVDSAPASGGPTLAVGSVDASAYNAQGVLVPLAFDATNVYSSDGTHVLQVARANGAVTTLATAQSGDRIHAVVVDASNIYWLEAASFSGYVYRQSLSSGTPTATVIATSYFDGQLFALTQDATNIYWAQDAEIFRLGK